VSSSEEIGDIDFTLPFRLSARRLGGACEPPAIATVKASYSHHS